MTKEVIAAAVEGIRGVRWDSEVAHSREDELRTRFIRHVAETASGELAGMARLVLATEDIDFERWCA